MFRITRRTIAAARTVTWTQLNDPRLVTITSYLRTLGADDKLIASTKSVLGRRIKQAYNAAGRTRRAIYTALKPRKCRAGWLTTTPGYAPQDLPLIAGIVASYPKTAHLVPEAA